MAKFHPQRPNLTIKIDRRLYMKKALKELQEKIAELSKINDDKDSDIDELLVLMSFAADKVEKEIDNEKE